MKNQTFKIFSIMAVALFLSVSALELTAEARIGGSRSFGSRGTRSYARPTTPYTQPGQSRQQVAPAPTPFQQQAGGGFMRSMAGGLMGGMLGSMLFSSFAGAGSAGTMGTGGGIGLFEILLLAGIGYLIFRYFRKKREGRDANPFGRK